MNAYLRLCMTASLAALYVAVALPLVWSVPIPLAAGIAVLSGFGVIGVKSLHQAGAFG